MLRLLVRLVLLVAPSAALVPPATAQQNGFDLSGPALSIAVTRDGATLPLSAVPALRAGDRITADVVLPEDQSVRYLLVVGFLRGATNPPPKDWFSHVRTWRKKGALTVVVPPGAEQAIAFLAPQTGGGFDTIVDAVRARPGVFVRAAQDLHQASLDRARLETFVTGIAAAEDRAPEQLASVSPVLASALAIRLNPECLTRPRALQAACLTQNREGMVLQTTRGTTLTETLIGTPTDLAYRIAATREGGAGYYSPYIGLARDLARLFGAFRTAQYQYVPALAVPEGGSMRLRLATPPSFRNPRSVLLTPLPPIASGPAAAPALHLATKAGVCVARADALLPVEDAPLLYAMDYARDLSLRIARPNGAVADLPLRADPSRGGLVIAEAATGIGTAAIATAVVRGRWGFDPLSIPVAAAQAGGDGSWTAFPDASVVVGREHPLQLRGSAPACVEQVALRDRDGALRPVPWTASGGTLGVTLPLANVRPGPLTLVVSQAGLPKPQEVALVAQVEASRLDGFVLHEGDTQGWLSGSRLDQVAELRLGNTRFVPGTLTRGKEGDRLPLSSGDTLAAVKAGQTQQASVRLKDGRKLDLAVKTAPARPTATLLSRAVELPSKPGSIALVLPDGMLPPDGRLTFSVRLENGQLGRDDAIEIGTAEAHALVSIDTGTLQRVGNDVAIATFRPDDLLGRGTAGQLRFRVVSDAVAGDWQPLARVVRLPDLTGLSCPPAAGDCTLSGNDLYTLSAIAGSQDFSQPVTVPPGFVGRQISLPRPGGKTLSLRLQDAPDLTVRAVF